MKNIKLLILLTLFFSGPNLYSEAPKTDSLKQLWSLAEKNSPGLKARIKQIESIEHSLKALPTWYIPDLYAEAGYSGAFNSDQNAHGPLFRLVAEWTLWDGGRTHYSAEYAKMKAEYVKWRQVLLTQELKKSIARVYFSISRLEELQNYYRDQIKQLQRLHRLLKPRLRIGRVGYSDLMEVQLRLLNVNNRQENIARTLSLTKQQLNLLVGRDPDETLEIAALLSLDTFAKNSAPKQLTFSELPDYQLSRAKIKSLEAELQLTNRNLYWPSVGVETYGGYGPHIDALDNQKPEAGLRLKFKMPLYSTRDRSSRLSAKKAKIEAARLDLKQYLIQARLDFNRKANRLANYQFQSKNLENIIEKARKNLSRAYNEFSRGLKSPGDMLTAIQTLARARKEYINLKMRRLNLRAEFYLLAMYTDSRTPPVDGTGETKTQK